MAPQGLSLPLPRPRSPHPRKERSWVPASLLRLCENTPRCVSPDPRGCLCGQRPAGRKQGVKAVGPWSVDGLGASFPGWKPSSPCCSVLVGPGCAHHAHCVTSCWGACHLSSSVRLACSHLRCSRSVPRARVCTRVHVCPRVKGCVHLYEWVPELASSLV